MDSDAWPRARIRVDPRRRGKTWGRGAAHEPFDLTVMVTLSAKVTCPSHLKSASFPKKLKPAVTLACIQRSLCGDALLQQFWPGVALVTAIHEARILSWPRLHSCSAVRLELRKLLVTRAEKEPKQL